ncbi:MAG: TetR/AcrR family transcriptional regulator [Actinomycetota bacterium]
MADMSAPSPRSAPASTPASGGNRTRMSSAARREQIIATAVEVFAESGVEGASVEELAANAGVSKPLIYEHFGSKEGLYAVVVDREMRALLELISSTLETGRPRVRAERAALAFLTYIETRSNGFRLLVRNSPVGGQSGSFATLLSEVASQVEHIFIEELASRGFSAEMAPMYASMLVGMVALTGQWWLDARLFTREEVAAHIVNLAWNGLSDLETHPRLSFESRRNHDR